MKPCAWILLLFAISRSNCKTIREEDDDAKPKRQAEPQARALGVSTQHIYGSAPGHYVLRTGPKEASEAEQQDYLSILRQIESGSLQAAAAQDRPALQQYLLPSRQPAYVSSQSAEPKVIQIPKRPVYAQSLQPQAAAALAYQQQRTPLVLRPSQAVRPTVQGIYTQQGFVASSPTHALHEARVQAALSVADDKQYAAQPSFQYVKPQLQQQQQQQIITAQQSGESSFEKELAQLVAANRAQELKAKPVQYIQHQEVPQKQYTFVQAKPKQSYTIPRPEVQAQQYEAPVARAKTPTQKQHPQQYLIETTKPEPPKAKPQVQYYQVTTEEPKFYYDSEDYSEKLSPMKVVAAPQLQHVQPQYRYRPQAVAAQKEAIEQTRAPAYLQYYQAIRAQQQHQQQDDVTSANDVKLEAYTPRFAAKARPTTPSPLLEQAQPSYNVKYEPQQVKGGEQQQQQYVRYKAAKPQLTSQFAATPEEESILRALFAQSLKNAQQQQQQQQSLSVGAYTTPKIAAGSEAKPQQVVPSHSSIFVSKAVTPKKVVRPKVVAEPILDESSSSDAAEEAVQTVRLPPPKNNKVYTQEEFQALVAAGYSVTPVPVTDDEESSAFSPAPVNYPGHSDYRPQQQQTQASVDVQSYSEPPVKTRKVARRRPASRLAYRLQPENSESETQVQPLAYAGYPTPHHEFDAQEARYGAKKQAAGSRPRVRQQQQRQQQQQQQHSEDEEAES